MDVAVEKQMSDLKSDSSLFDEFTCIAKCYIAEEVAKWNESNLSTDQRWVQIFTHLKAVTVTVTVLVYALHCIQVADTVFNKYPCYYHLSFSFSAA